MLRKGSLVLTFLLLALCALSAQAKTVTIEGKDNLRFSVENITVQPGEEVTVKLVNNTKMPAQAMSHNFVLLTAGADATAINNAAMSAKDNDYIPASKSDQILAHTAMIAGGESDSVTFTAPEEPGEHTYLCSFPGHFAAGMKGTLTVEAGE